MNIAYLISQYCREFIANETHGEIVRELQKRNLNVHVLSTTTRTGTGGTAGNTVGEYGEPITRLVTNASIVARASNNLVRQLTHYNYFLPLVLAIKRWLARNPVDVIHVEGVYPLGAAVWCATRPAKQPFVVTTTGGDIFDLPQHGYGFGRYRFPRALIQRTLRSAAWVRTNSPMMSELVWYLGADPRRTTCVPVSIGDSCYPPAGCNLSALRTEARKHLADQNGWMEPFWVSSIGRLFNLKAPEQLLYAAPMIIEKLGPTRFIIAGPSRSGIEGDYLTFLQQIVSQSGLNDFVSFPGRISLEAVQTLLAASDVLAIPSRIEGLNRVTIEAAAVGTPTVITATAGAASLVDQYGNGIVIPPNNPTELAAAIVQILRDPVRWQRAQSSGLPFAEAQRSSAVASHLHTIYRYVNHEITSIEGHS